MTGRPLTYTRLQGTRITEVPPAAAATTGAAGTGVDTTAGAARLGVTPNPAVLPPAARRNPPCFTPVRVVDDDDDAPLLLLMVTVGYAAAVVPRDAGWW